MQYSAVGSVVRLCRQLRGFNDRYGTSIILSESVYQHVKSRFFCRLLDKVTVEGSEGSIYELISAYDNSVTETQKRCVEDYQKAVAYKYTQQPEQALDLLQTLAKITPQDGAVQYLIACLQQDSEHGRH
jgi:hypothetical protein